LIGLIYADYQDANFSDTFHRYVCNSFQHVNLKHHSDVLALTDPSVTIANLSLLLAKCDFIFYWGHGRSEETGDFSILGSTGQEQIPFSSLSAMLYKKVAYFDACGLGSKLKQHEIKDCTIACPIKSVSYDISVRVGCTTMLGLLGSNLTFNRAFQQATDLTLTHDLYALCSSGVDIDVNIPVAVKLSLVECFSNILHMWLQQKNG